MDTPIFTLNLTDKGILKSWGYPTDEFPQIEEAVNRSVYTLTDKEKETKISWNKAMELLGQRDFLSGISRSAFHWSASRMVDKNRTIYFDSSVLFE